MIVLKTRRQKLKRVQFSSAGGLLAFGPTEAVHWVSPGGKARSFGQGSQLRDLGYTWDARAVVVCMALGVTYSPLGSGAEVVIVHQEDDRDVIPSPVDGHCLLHRQGRPLDCRYLAQDQRPKQVWSRVAEYATGRPTFLPGGTEFVQSEFRGWRQDHGAMWLVVRRTADGRLTRQAEVRHFADRLAISSDGQTVCLIQGETVIAYGMPGHPAAVRRVTSPTAKGFTDIDYHPSGRYFAATNNDGTVRLYDTESWQLVQTFAWDVGRLRCVAFSPDGLLAAAGSDTGRVVVWDVDL